MADIKLSLGQVNITDYLIVRIREVAAPTAIVDQQPFGPAPSGAINVFFPNVNPVTHYVDFYESSNGTILTSLLAIYTVDARTNQLIYERRFYVVGVSPFAVAGQPNIIDPYLNGKTIAGFAQRAFGAMIPTVEWSFSGSTITNLIGPLSDGDTYYVDITYLQPVTVNSNKQFFAGIKTLSANTTLDNTYYNNRVRINGGNSHVLPDAGTVPDGTMFYFISQQLGIPQAKISSTSNFLQPWGAMTEMWLGKGEYLWLEKVTISGTAYYEVINSHPNLEFVGQRFSGTSTQSLNVLAEDDSIHNAADYPRMWWWLNNKADAGTGVVDDSLTRPANKQGVFIISPTNQTFRMPNTQGLSEKGLANFSSFGGDGTRAYDYPGGYQADQVGEITISLNKGNGYTGGAQNADWFGPGDPAHPQDGGYDNITANAGKVNTVKNFGVIYYRHV
jgi:hypothetical protein